jgi:hypothetical protein
MWCEYNGTSDVMQPQLYDTNEEMADNWRNADWTKKCTCGKLEPVKIHAQYGGGIDWEGEACRDCKCLNHDHLTYDWKEEQEYRERNKNNGWGWRY